MIVLVSMFIEENNAAKFIIRLEHFVDWTLNEFRWRFPSMPNLDFALWEVFFVLAWFRFVVWSLGVQSRSTVQTLASRFLFFWCLRRLFWSTAYFTTFESQLLGLGTARWLRIIVFVFARFDRLNSVFWSFCFARAFLFFFCVAQRFVLVCDSQGSAFLFIYLPDYGLVEGRVINKKHNFLGHIMTAFTTRQQVINVLSLHGGLDPFVVISQLLNRLVEHGQREACMVLIAAFFYYFQLCELGV